MDNGYLSRKFLLTLILIIVSSLMTYFKVISSETLIEFFKWILLGYFGANVAEKFTQNK